MMTSPWANFGAFLMVQVAVFLIVVRIGPFRLREAVAIIPTSVALGVPLGLLFDLIIGNAGAVFTYHIQTSWLFLVVNGALSYGLAVATASLLPPTMLTGRHRNNRHLTAAMLVGCVALIALLTTHDSRLQPLATMCYASALVLAIDEVAALLFRRQGLLGLAMTGKPRAFASVWLWSSAIGLAYEIGNYYFPVWHWSLIGVFSYLTVEVFIVSSGYFVLFYTLAILSTIVSKPVPTDQQTRGE
jgi:hypothetical protein